MRFRSADDERLLQPPGQAPPDITVPVPAANGSHLGGSAESDGGGWDGRDGAAGGAADLWAALSFGGGGGGRGGFRSALSKLLSRGNDLEAAAVNHKAR